MKKKIWIYPLIVMGFLFMHLTSCTKDTIQADFASKIAGTYSGTVTVVGTGTASCTSTLVKSTETVVNLTILIGTTSIPLNGITVTSSGNIYNLSYTDSSGSFTGKVDGNTLTWTLVSGSTTDTFSGTKH
jgi:hypothetical protein